MASFDLILSQLRELSEESWGENAQSIRYFLKNFRNGIEFLSRFVSCIRHWSNVMEVAPHLGSLANKVEASVQKIKGEFIEELSRDEPASEYKLLSFNLSGSLQKRAQEGVFFFQQSMAKIDVLKQEIAEAYDDSESIIINSVKCVSPLLNFNEWKEFVISTNFHVPDDRESFYASTSRTEIKLVKGPSLFEEILDILEYDNLRNPKIEAFWVKIGSSIISAGMLSCQWWAKNFNPKFPNMKQDVDAAFRDLGQKVSLTNPEFIDIILGEQKYTGKFISIANIIVNRLIPSLHNVRRIESSFLDPLRSELRNMVTTVVNIPKEDASLQILLPDIKQLILEIASLRHLLFSHDRRFFTVKDINVLVDLLRMVCLIKVEIFLRIEFAADFKLEDQIDVLRHSAFLLAEVSFGGSERTKFAEFADQIYKLVKEVATDAGRYGASVSWLMNPLDKGLTEKEITRLRLLLKTLLIKGEILFLKLQDKLLDSFKEPIENLHMWFKIIIPLVIKDEKVKFSDVEVVASKIIWLYHRILDQDISESQEMFQSMNISVSDVVDEVNVIMKEFEIYLGGTYLRVRNSDFPKTNAAGFVDSLLKKLQDFVSYGMNLVESVITKGQILEIVEYLQFFQTFLWSDISKEDNKHVRARLINVCYEAEYLIDFAIHGKEDEWHNDIWQRLYLIIQEMRKIKIHVSSIQSIISNKSVKMAITSQEIRDIKTQVSSTQSMISNKSVKNPIISRTTTPEIVKDLVELVDQEKMLIDQLVAGSEKLFTISIVGMPGIGKTTLAKRVYNNSEVFTRFGNRRAWCCVSEIYRKKDVLLEILSLLIALTEDIRKKIDEDLELMLYQILKTGRYLIVLDDVWDTDVLDDLVRIFPDDGNASRILITSRHNNVALRANPNADPHHIRQLSDSESWELLQMKIFREKSCPEEFKEIGMQIAGSCKGLPLAIIAIAGLLGRTEMQQSQWKDIAESLSSKIIDDPEEPWRHILELSYEKLPDCLKACFLYFGAFLEDQDIPARKLMQLWIAEGFVPETEFKTMEDVAEDYLMDLIGRSLVIISKQRSRGSGDGAKACRIHDVLRKLCQLKAKEDKFMQVITRSNASNNANLYDLDYLFSANFGNPSSLSSVVTYEALRICLCSKLKHFIDSRPSAPHVRSLLCSPTGEEDLSDTSFSYRSFRFLKVLDLECINIGNSFPQDILLLLHLRYLAVFGKIESVPESIANLWNLETFILKGLRVKVTLLPHTIFRLKKLRHVCVSDFAAIKFSKDSSQLDYLVTVSSLILPFGEDTDYILMQFPNLRKLKCIFSESDQFPNLKVLNQLESLKVTYYGLDVSSRGELCFSSNLKKLTLTNFRLPWDKISAIGRLPNLEVLKLLSRAFVGEEWEMAEGEFVGLKYLKLENLDVSKWNANGDCLPKLQQLVLRSCKNLEIPGDIAELTTLQIIDVLWCGDRAEESARQIREDGDEILKVFINFAELPIPNS